MTTPTPDQARDAVAATDSAAQFAAKIRNELMFAKMTHNFTFTRDELIALLGESAAPESDDAVEAATQVLMSARIHGTDDGFGEGDSCRLVDIIADALGDEDIGNATECLEAAAFDMLETAYPKLTARVQELQGHLNKLHGAKFSDRSYHALRSRAEKAEREAEKFQRMWFDDSEDAQRYRWLKTASKPEYLLARGAFGLDDAAIDAAQEHLETIAARLGVAEADCGSLTKEREEDRHTIEAMDREVVALRTVANFTLTAFREGNLDGVVLRLGAMISPKQAKAYLPEWPALWWREKENG